MKREDQTTEQEDRCFHYAQEDLTYLAGLDAKLAWLINAVGPIKRRIWPDLFTGMARTIMGQQISAKAHEAVWKRFLARFGDPVPETVLAAQPEELQACGLSARKAGYIRNISLEFANGNIEADKLAKMGNNALAEYLCKFPGIGQWSAEMLLIFTFQRPDVISYNDLGIRRALMKIYGEKDLSLSRFSDLTSKFGHAATLASFYLWESANLTQSAWDALPAK